MVNGVGHCAQHGNSQVFPSCPNTDKQLISQDGPRVLWAVARSHDMVSFLKARLLSRFQVIHLSGLQAYTDCETSLGCQLYNDTVCWCFLFSSDP